MLDWLVTHRGTVQGAFLFCLFLAAWFKGGQPEKAAAFVMFVLIWLLDRVFHFVGSGGESFWSLASYTYMDTGHLVIDTIAVVSFLAIGLYANRIYPFFMAALQLIATFSHFARELMQDGAGLAYAVLQAGPSYGQIIVLFFGLVLHARRAQKYPGYPDWRKT